MDACAILDTPIGALLAVSDHDALARIDFAGSWSSEDLDPAWRRGAPVLAALEEQLREYFAGARRAFDLPLAPHGTAFQRQVWTALQGIAYGTTTSYAAIATSIGAPKAVRAVGSANGDNHVCVLIPCHRVIRSDGSLGGYGGGIERKKKLLASEGHAMAEPELPLAE